MRIVVAQIGARRHYAVPRALFAESCLETLLTDFHAGAVPTKWFVRGEAWLPPSLVRMCLRRVNGIPVKRIRTLPGWVVTGLLDFRHESSTVRWARRNAAFCRVASRSGFGGADAVYAFNGAALELFREARSRGLGTVLDQTAAPWRWNSELLREETRLWPSWEARPAEIDDSGLMAAREEAEWELADRIICGSKFIVEAMADIGGPVEKCVVVPYPTPGPVVGRSSGQEEHSRDGPLRVLYVGTSQLRKGIQYLWRAKQILGDAISVRAVGPSLLSESANARLGEIMDLRGARPRSEIPQHLAWADVLVLPTLSEGAANVCFEAQGAGVPVLTTFAAGSAVEHGKDGWLVESRDVDSLVEFLHNADRVRDMGKALDGSPDRIPQRSLENYGVDLVTAIGYGVGLPSTRVADPR